MSEAMIIIIVVEIVAFSPATIPIKVLIFIQMNPLLFKSVCTLWKEDRILGHGVELF